MRRKRAAILWKTIRLGVRMKTPVSMLVSVLAIPAALIPLLLSKQLAELTDLLTALSGGGLDDMSAVGGALALLAILFLLHQFSMFLTEYCAAGDKYRTLVYMKEFVLRQICEVHYAYIENKDDFVKRIEFADTYAVTEMSNNVQAVFLVLQQLVTFFSISAAMWAVHPALVLILVFTGIPAAVLSYKQSDETFRHRAKWSEEGALAIHYYQLCSKFDYGMQEVRHYELFDYLKARWRAVADRYILVKNKLTTKHLKANLSADFLHSAVYLVILFLTAGQIYKNSLLGVGTFTLVYTLSSRLQKSTGAILTQIMRFSSSLFYLGEFFSLEDLARDEEEREGEALHKAVRSGAGEISFAHVSFRYPGADREAVRDITVSIQKGEKIAIVGDNGSGKSTFISLLTGVFSPDSGRIAVDGLELEQHKREVRDRLSVIFQDFAHYGTSLRENITVSDRERKASDEEITELARQIGVEDVIEEQPEGLDSMLGHMSQKGNNLSGGQWQKLALIRAMYRNGTDIMILDEPTAALDPVSEAELYRNFARITGERTTLLISHRLGITKLVDRILVFRDGQIIEDGSHQELMERKGHYYDMYQAQAQWYQ